MDYYPAKYKVHLTFSPLRGLCIGTIYEDFINGREFVDEKVVDKMELLSVTGGFESGKQ